MLLPLLPSLITRPFTQPSIAVQQVRELTLRPPRRRGGAGFLVLRCRQAGGAFRLRWDDFHFAFAFALRRWVLTKVQRTRGLERCGRGRGRGGFRDRSGQIGGEVLVSPTIDESGPEVTIDQPFLVGPLSRDRTCRRRPVEL